MNWQVVKWDFQPPVEQPVEMDNVIATVYWKISKGSSVNTGFTILNPPSLESYIPLQELNEAQVLVWVFDTMGPEEKAAQEAML